MTHMTDADWAAVREKHAAMTPDEASAWIRKVMGRLVVYWKVQSVNKC